MVKKPMKVVVGAYETHLFSMTAVRKWKIVAFFLLPVWNTTNLDQNDSLQNDKKLMNLQHQKSHTDICFRFRDFLQYVTVPSNFS